MRPCAAEIYLGGASFKRPEVIVNNNAEGNATLWANWLQHENAPAVPMKYHTFIEYRRVVAASAVVVHRVGESSGGPLPIYRTLFSFLKAAADTGCIAERMRASCLIPASILLHQTAGGRRGERLLSGIEAVREACYGEAMTCAMQRSVARNFRERALILFRTVFMFRTCQIIKDNDKYLQLQELSSVDAG
ncbi:hypothetical protein EVAR_46574_1 [Eumeta japonica]|uniref:Uncharacterized protein n=1 Tax=Eumeta variegata TaxID=151549 RepID=A0A4C1WT64_EUMVA|nr:hypothetical protein EVAR_46574_1 [Eumeta japonica]